MRLVVETILKLSMASIIARHGSIECGVILCSATEYAYAWKSETHHFTNFPGDCALLIFLGVCCRPYASAAETIRSALILIDQTPLSNVPKTVHLLVES